MPIVASAGKAFTPHAAGAFAATCIDVADLGEMEVVWQGRKKVQHKVEIIFFCGQWGEKDDGTKFPFTVRRRFTLSLAENGNLRPFLEAWRNRKFTAEELKGFDLEKLIGAPAYLQVSHNDTERGTFANIDVVMKMPQGMSAPGIPQGYVRYQDRPKEEAQPQPQSQGDPFGDYKAPTLEDDDDLPF